MGAVSNTVSLAFDHRHIQPLPRGRAGRPTRAQSEQRQRQLLDQALEVFLDRGFEMTTIEAIADAVGMTKRTDQIDAMLARLGR